MRTAIEVLHFSPIAGLSQRPRRRRRLAAAVVALAAVMVLLVQPAAADTYTWDVGGGTSHAHDGSGTWSTGTPYQNWWNGTTDLVWPSGGTDTAVFGAGAGIAGTVTVDAVGVSVGAMIFNPTGDGTYAIAGGPITLAGTAPTITMNASASIGSSLSGSNGLTVRGSGSLELTASNSYTGQTTLSGNPILRLSNSAALPTTTNLTLDGGVVELNAGDFTRSLGTGPGQVQFTANAGGFAAVGANRSVNLSNSATLTWGSTNGFLPSGAWLTLGTQSADSTLNFQNPLNLGSGTQTIQVTAGSGSASVDAQLTGAISGSGGLTIIGGGDLELTASNSYSGPTTVSGATLRLSNSTALPGGIGAASAGSNLTLDGGVIELNAGDFTRNLGTGPGQVQFTANGGGFSAVGGNRIVNLGGNSATLTWGGSGSFLPGPSSARARQLAADSMVDFQNPIRFWRRSGPQTVRRLLAPALRAWPLNYRVSSAEAAG